MGAWADERRSLSSSAGAWYQGPEGNGAFDTGFHNGLGKGVAWYLAKHPTVPGHPDIRRPVEKPDQGLDDVAELSDFVRRHLGAFDDFLFDDPVDGEQRRVRFADDTLALDQVVNKIWEAKNLTLISVS